MKLFFTLLFSFITISATFAQWSNTTNTFTDDLHMPICTSTGDQTNPMVIESFPDGGYFVVWEDHLNISGTPAKVFAQKYDKTGKALWPANGLAVSDGANNQQYTWNSNQDYRNRKIAATDNNGGLFITYTDDSINGTDWTRIALQHFKSNGSRVFSGAGKIMAATPSGQTYTYVQPQLIADNDGGFYIAYFSTGHALNDYVYIYNYSDDGGTLTFHGGGLVNDNTISQNIGNPCGGPRYALSYPGTTVHDYNIWPDLQGNCSIVISMNGNIGSQGYMLCYNKAFKVKQDQAISIAHIDPNLNGSVSDSTYRKGSVDILYQFRQNPLNSSCGVTGPTYYVWVDYLTISFGFLELASSEYPFENVKGTTLATGGNINAELVTANGRTVIGNTVSNSCTTAFGFTDEIYTAIPYQRASNANPSFGYNTVKPAGLDSIGFFNDTLLAPGIYPYDYSLSGGGTHAYTSALIWEDIAKPYNVRLQHLTTQPVSAGLYKFQYETPDNKGVIIGNELSTCCQTSSIDYDFPVVTANATGNALFSINEVGRFSRVSPIINGAQLSWGAMGKPIGTPVFNNININVTGPFPAVDPTDGTGVITWFDQRNVNTGGGQDIFIRHLDDLNAASYSPPNKKVIPFPGGINFANPLVLLSTTMKYTTIEGYDPSTGAISPVAAILDNYNLGAVPVNFYENTQTIRNYAGKPYLDRNYAITPEHNPAGAADINVRLYFTTAQFDALKLADPGITDPGSLSVIKQTNTTNGTPAAEFTPDGSEIELKPISWLAVDGGYYVEIVVNSFSNFFIQKSTSPLPLTWLGIQAIRTDNKTAKISWQVADQQNVKDYTVQQSTDGITFTNGCSLSASAVTSYNCSLPAPNNIITYYRVLQRDEDDKYSYSKTVTLQPSGQLSITVYPNPAKDLLHLDGLTTKSLIRITDISGKLILQQTGTPGSNQINIADLPFGLYTLTIISAADTRNFKFLKE